jgi:hypothetical protein
MRAKAASKAQRFVNNRFEGNALETIAAIVDALQQPEAA